MNRERSLNVLKSETLFSISDKRGILDQRRSLVWGWDHCVLTLVSWHLETFKACLLKSLLREGITYVICIHRDTLLVFDFNVFSTLKGNYHNHY